MGTKNVAILAFYAPTVAALIPFRIRARMQSRILARCVSGMLLVLWCDCSIGCSIYGESHEGLENVGVLSSTPQ